MSARNREILNKWGLYPWFLEHGTGCIHRLDQEAFKALMPYGKVFHCVAIQDDFIVLEYSTRHFRVIADLFKAVNPPAFSFGSKVQVKATSKLGTVEGIEWHYKRDEEFYFLNIDMRVRSRRYFRNELELASS